MVDTPRKTFPELQALSAPLVDSDVVAVYRSPGPAKRTTASVLKAYAQTGVQPLDADLTAIAALTSAADKMPYATGAGTWAMADLTSFARTLLATASNSAFMTALGNIASTAINFLQAGTSAVTRTLSSVIQEEVRITDFGAVGDGVTDNATAIAAAITYAKTLVAPVLIIPRGEFYFTGTLTFDLPTSSTLLCYGRFTSNVSGASAIILGSASTNPNGFVVRGLSVARTTYDMNGAGATSGSVGVEILNLVVSNVEIKKVANFTYGVKVNGTQANGGVSYNIFDLFHIYDNKINLWLTASGVGYCNENIFNGGAFNHSTSYPNYTGTQNILVDHFATSVLNNNRFMNPTFEDNSALSVAATINGLHNCIYWPRMENPAALTTYQIIFTVNSQACSLIGQGYGVTDTNITDLGSGNCYQTKNGSSISASTGTSAGEGVVRLKSFASSAAKLILGKDTGNTETWSIDGQGIGSFNQRVYAENGFRWSTSSGTRNDRGFFPSSGSPEGAVTADPGSLSTNNSGGDGVTLYVKESGGGNTGWKAVGTYIAGSATYDAPSIAPAGTTTTTVTVTGAALGDFATCSFGLTLAGLVATAYVSAADTVTVVLFNPTLGAIDLASTTLRVRVMPV
jgi:hypothetical protein